jgi:ATP-binding cassette subfamily C protein
MTALLPTATARQSRTVLRQLIRPHRGLAVAAFAVMTLGTVVGLAVAPILGRIVDGVVAGKPALAVPVTMLIVIGLAQGGLVALGLTLVARLGESALATLRERFVARALHLPLDRLEQAGTGDLTARVTGDVTVTADAVRTALPELTRASLAIVLTLAGMAVLDWRFLLAALLAAPVQIHTVRWYVRRAAPLYAAQRIAAGARSHQLVGTIGGAATVRAFRIGSAQRARVAARSEEAVALTLDTVRLQTRFWARLNLAEFIGLSAVLATGFLLVRADAVTIGTATAAALYFHNLFNPITSALGLADEAQAAVAAVARIVGVAQLPGTPPVIGARTSGDVHVTGVGHSYLPGRPVLTGIDLHIRAGETVALVGTSGAGKTTLAKLIAGVLTPTSGTIGIGTPGVSPSPGPLVGLVTQEVHVFAGTLADDLRLAAPDATDDDLRTALTTVGALRWADALPSGWSTVVGDGGHRLTAGQAQQLALARLVLSDPAVVVLDEATAEAGSAGARDLEDAAAQVVADRTGVIVAHRLTQAAAADRIVVLDGGRIAETGTHAELLATGGAYATLWKAWSDQR